MFWDDLIDNEITAARQLIEAYIEKQTPIICSFEIPEDRISHYWILETTTPNDSIFKVKKFLEKPKATETKSRNWNIWKYVLTPDIFKYLEKINFSWMRLRNKTDRCFWIIKTTKRHTLIKSKMNSVWYLK